MAIRTKNSKLPKLIDDSIIGLEKEFNDAVDYWKPDRRRLIDNGRMFWAADYGQWPDYVVAELLAERRQLPTINIIGDNIKKIVGFFLRNKLDIKFEPMTSDVNSLSLLVQDMWYSDWELGDNDTSWINFLRDGLIMQGYEQMVVTEEPDNDPLGHIAFRHRSPFDITLDPNWKTMYSRDLRKYWFHPILSLQEIKEIYPNKIEEIDSEYELQKKNGKQFGENQIYPNADLDTRWGGNHQVQETHRLELEKDWCEYNIKAREWFPDGSEKEKIVYAKKMDLSEDDIINLPRKKLVYYVTTIAPTLSKNMYLENRKHEIQIGRLDLFPWGLERWNGHFKGIPDILDSMQKNINQSVLDMTDIRQRTSRGGAKIIDPLIVDNDSTKMNNIEDNVNKPGFFEWSKPGALAGGASQYMLEIPESRINQDLSWFANYMMELSERLTMPQAAQGRSESSRETGKLFQNKYEAFLVASGEMYKTIDIHEAEKAEAWLKQAKISYAGGEREFAGMGNKGGFKVNYRVPLTDGNYGVENDISKLPRMKIIVTQSPKGINVRTSQRGQLTELWQNMPKGLSTAPLVVLSGIFDTIEQSDEMKEKSKKYLDLDLQVAESIANRTLSENSLLEFQAKTQLEQLKQQIAQPPQPGPEQGAPIQVTPGDEGLNEESMIEGTPQEKIINQRMVKPQAEPQPELQLA